MNAPVAKARWVIILILMNISRIAEARTGRWMVLIGV